MKAVLCACLMSAIAPSAVLAQDEKPIRRGDSVAATVTSGTPHRYAIELEDGMYVFGHADQLTVDVVVRILGPDGKPLRTFDGPDRGPEAFNFDTKAKGKHVIEVAAFGKGSGNYVLKVLRIERVARDPKLRTDQLLAAFSGNSTPGVVVGVVQDGKLAFSKAYGMANLSHNIPFTTATISNIGSVTKQFTAMGILLLQADGKLSLDDDVRKHIPELPDFGATTTLRHLLTHTGGYRELYNLLPMTGFGGEDVFAREKVIEIVQRQPELQAQPSTEFNYNNTGFILLSMVIERASGKTFPDFMKARVFEPLGMMNTRMKASQGEIIPGSAQGYVAAQGGAYREARDLPASAGAGGIYTTVDDLAKWMLNYRDKRLGGPQAVDAITTNTKLKSGDSTGYGLGMGVGKFRGRTRYTHTGGDVAHRAYFGYYPELASGVIIMSNNASFSLDLAQDITLAFLADRFDPEPKEAPKPAGSGTMSPVRLRAIVGKWQITPPGATLDIVYTLEDGQLFAQATGQPKFKVTPTSDSTATVESVNATITFRFVNDSTVNQGTLHQGGAIPMVRGEKRAITPQQLVAFSGRYYSDEIETGYELKVERDTLRLHNVRMQPIVLIHQSGDEFTTSAFFLGTIKFMRAGNGSVTGFTASNGRTKNVWFRRDR